MFRSGFLEKFNTQVVSGWIPSEKKSEKVTIIFSCGEEIIVSADIERKDLSCAGYGFECKVPHELRNMHDVSVRVFYDNQKEIVNSPRSIVTDPVELKKVLHGKDDWLFLVNDSNDSLDYILGKKVLSDSTISLWVERIRQRANLAKKYNTRCYHILSPEKPIIYEEYLPDGLVVSSDRPVVKLMNALKEQSISEVIYPSYSNRDQYSDIDFLYSKGDTHWTYVGAYYATDEFVKLCESNGIQIQLYNLSDYSFRSSYQASDLLVKTTRTNVEKVMFTKSISKRIRMTYHNEVRNTGRRMEFINFDAPKIRLMSYHSSSIDWMMPFLNDMFGSICYIWGSSIDWNEVLRYQPDVLLVQSNERFLQLVPNDLEVN